MDRAEIDTWAGDFIADLQVGGERIPLDRVLARHLDMIGPLLSHGLTWNDRACWRAPNGRPISPERLRANVERLQKRYTKDAQPTGWRGSSLRPPCHKKAVDAWSCNPKNLRYRVNTLAHSLMRVSNLNFIVRRACLFGFQRIANSLLY
jgi:hypothetical protein